MSRAFFKRSVLVCVALVFWGPRQLWSQDQPTPQPEAPAAVAAPQVSPQSEGPAAESTAEGNTGGNQPAAGSADMALPTYSRKTENRPASGDVADRIEQALDKPVVVDFNEAPFGEVMAHLQQYCQIPIYLDLKALDEVGFGADSPVTISVKDISLRSTLELLLGELELTYTIRDESLSITTPEQADSALLVRVYPVADFAVPAPPSLIVPEPYSRYSVLLRLLAECVAPQTWEEVGGAGSALVYEPWGVLVVTQTQQVHEELELLLAALRKTRAVSATAGAAAEDATQAAVPIVVQQGQKRIEQALDSVVTFDFNEAPLAEVVAFLVEDRGIPILIDKKALDDVGLSGDTPVTLAVRDMTMRSALRLVLRPLDLGFTVRHEVLLVTTPEELDNQLEIRVYSVADFLSETNPTANPLEADTQIRSLQDVVERTVSPDTWDHVGGAGSLAPVSVWGVMVISQTEDTHSQVEDLFRQTRQTRQSLASGQSAQVVPGELLSGASVPLPSAVLAPGDIPVVAQTLVIPGASLAPATALGPAAMLAQPSLSPSMVLKLYTVPDFESDQLAKAIRGTVAPLSWTNDPAGPAIFTVGTNLLIRQTESEHALIAQLIQGLRPRKGAFVPR